MVPTLFRRICLCTSSGECTILRDRNFQGTSKSSDPVDLHKVLIIHKFRLTNGRCGTQMILFCPTRVPRYSLQYYVLIPHWDRGQKYSISIGEKCRAHLSLHFFHKSMCEFSVPVHFLSQGALFVGGDYKNPRTEIHSALSRHPHAQA